MKNPILIVIASVAIVVVVIATLSPPSSTTAVPTPAPEGDDPAPAYIDLTGIIRDFRERTETDGHPDFERKPDRGFAHFTGNVSHTLDEDGLPAFTGEGFKIANQWRDKDHRQICPCLYDADLGDVEGGHGLPGTGGITSAESFSQWFRDVPGVNLSKTHTVRLMRQPDGSYVFDDKLDDHYRSLGGFLPIDDQLFGNSPGAPRHNYHFTFVLRTNFTYVPSEDQFFKFTGDDDVFVYVDGRLVIDLGGVHAAHDQYLDMTRLGLVEGEEYEFAFFFAERHRTQSNFRIQTNILMSNTTPRSVTGGYD